MKIKIIEFNILNGFYSEKEPYAHHKDRQQLAVEFIAKENPDILVLTEANFASPSKYNILQDYKRIFTFPHYFYGRGGSKAGTAILSKFPLKGIDYSMFHRQFIRTKIKIGRKSMFLDAAHPHPELPDWEKERFFKGIIRDKQSPYVLAGDLNALSPQDSYNKEKVIQGFSRFTANPKEIVEDLLKRSAISHILKQGFIDSFVVANKPWAFTVPTDFLSLKKDSGVRLDYIFCSKDIKVIDAGIIQNDLTNKASDHFPIFAIVEV